MNNSRAQLQKLFSEGSALLQAGNSAQAFAYLQSALEIDPSNPTLHLFAGTALHELRRFDEAVICYEKAILSAPFMGEAHNNLGNSLMALGRFAEAAGSYGRAISLMPSSPVPLTARATSLQALGKIIEAEAECRAALKLDPSFASAHWNLALNLLLQGNYAEGWQEYEWRWQKPDFTSPARHNDVPVWDGSPLNGRAILLHAEQGFGDAIQFARYAPLVAQCGGTVLIECHPPLARLMRSLEGVESVIPFGEPLPVFDCQAPLLSLPRIFGTSVATIPSHVPYLSVTADRQEAWDTLLLPERRAVKAGLVWAGKSYPDPLRSCRLADLAPLAMIPDVIFYSLQMGAGSEQATSPPPHMKLIDVTDRIHDFSDTAALINQLDLVISIDTAVAHLAGALGKPVLLMLPFAPDWRWLLGRDDSPWYPGMRLFRQERPGIWSDVVPQLYAALEKSRQQKIL
jgi:Flp pilus assembly protein TadD